MGALPYPSENEGGFCRNPSYLKGGLCPTFQEVGGGGCRGFTGAGRGPLSVPLGLRGHVIWVVVGKAIKSHNAMPDIHTIQYFIHIFI